MNLVAIIQYVSSGEVEHGFSYYFYNAFNFEAEKNLPTYFSVILLFSSSITFLIIRLLVSSNIPFYIKSYWSQMSFIFLVLSIDEMVRLHERMGYITRNYIPIEATGFFRYAWVVPMIGLLIVFGLYSIKFLMYIPKNLSKGYIIAGFLYVLGALGFEMVSAKISTLPMYDAKDLHYYLAMSTEESLEMVSIIILLYFNLEYMKELSASNNPQA
jgi:hypothetical protein